MHSTLNRALGMVGLMSLIFSSQPLVPVFAYEATVEIDRNEQVDDITKQILRKELELLRLNTRFRLESTNQPRGRRWRQFLYTETNASCTEAGQITRMATSYPFTQKPAPKASAPSAKVPLVEGAAEVSMIGQIFSATGELCELSSNFVHYAQSRKRGLDPKSYRAQVCKLVAQIDDLQKNRDHAMLASNEAAPDQSNLNKAEGNLIHDLRDIAVSQYKQYHTGAIRLRFFQNAAYLASITKNTLGAAGNMVNIQSSHIHDPKLGGAASLLSLAAGAVTMATPVFGRTSGNLAGLIDRCIVSKDFEEAQSARTSEFLADKQKLATLVSVRRDESLNSAPFSSRCSEVYERVAQLLQAEERSTELERKRAKQTTAENVVYGTMVGSSRITQGVTGMLAAWEYPNQRWMASRMTAAGATAYGSGTAFNILETARVRLSDELQTKALKRQGLLPSQELQKRLTGLNDIEHSLGTELVVEKPASPTIAGTSETIPQ